MVKAKLNEIYTIKQKKKKENKQKRKILIEILKNLAIRVLKFNFRNVH